MDPFVLIEWPQARNQLKVHDQFWKTALENVLLFCSLCAAKRLVWLLFIGPLGRELFTMTSRLIYLFIFWSLHGSCNWEPVNLNGYFKCFFPLPHICFYWIFVLQWSTFVALLTDHYGRGEREKNSIGFLCTFIPVWLYGIFSKPKPGLRMDFHGNKPIYGTASKSSTEGQQSLIATSLPELL